MLEPVVADWVYMAFVAVLAFGSAIVGGISGFGAGLIITPLLLPVVGVKGVVPVIGVAMVLGNLSRLVAYRAHVERKMALGMLAAILPGTVLGVLLFTVMPARLLAVIIGCILILAVPARRYLKGRQVKPAGSAVWTVAFLCGVLAGNAPGGGIVIITVLLGMGLSGPALLGTDAIIGTAISLTNSLLFGGFGLLDGTRLIIGLIVGSAMIPGAFIARALVGRMQAETHLLIIEIFVVMGGLSFFWAAIAGP